MLHFIIIEGSQTDTLSSVFKASVFISYQLRKTLNEFPYLEVVPVFLL